MRIIFKKICLGCLLLALTGCAGVCETAKKVWGSSTQALEEARVDGISKVYNCTFDECFEAALSLDRNNESLKSKTLKFYEVFIRDRIKSLIIVMGIEGNVDTTEVGIFFSRLSPQMTKIEISSLSTTAKEKVARAVFAELESRSIGKKD